MSLSGQFIEVWCLSVKIESGVVTLTESSEKPYGDRSGENISSAGLNDNMVICGLKETALFS